jgi:hypothetical protein
MRSTIPLFARMLIPPPAVSDPGFTSMPARIRNIDSVPESRMKRKNASAGYKVTAQDLQ